MNVELLYFCVQLDVLFPSLLLYSPNYRNSHFQPLFFTCDYPAAASLMFAFTGVQYFFLFLAFYKKAYNNNTNNKSKMDKKLVEANNNVVDSKLE